MTLRTLVIVLLTALPYLSAETLSPVQGDADEDGLCFPDLSYLPRHGLQCESDFVKYVSSLHMNGTRFLVRQHNQPSEAWMSDHAEANLVQPIIELDNNAQLQDISSFPDSSVLYLGTATVGDSITDALADQVLSAFMSAYPSHHVILVGVPPSSRPCLQASARRIDTFVSSADVQEAPSDLCLAGPCLVIFVNPAHGMTEFSFLQMAQSLMPFFASHPTVAFASLPLSLAGGCKEGHHRTRLCSIMKPLAPVCNHCHPSDPYNTTHLKMKWRLEKMIADHQPLFMTPSLVRAAMKQFSAYVIHTAHGQVSQIVTWNSLASITSWFPTHTTFQSVAASLVAPELAFEEPNAMVEHHRVRRQALGQLQPPMPTPSKSSCPAVQLTTLAGANLSVVSILEEPFLSNSSATATGKLEGFSRSLLVALARQLKFNYTLRLVKDGKFGSQTPNGSWSGMVGEVVNCESDMVVAPLTISLERARAVTFSVPFMQIGLQIGVRRTNLAAPSTFQFLSPLSFEVWIIIFSLGIATSIALAVINAWSPYSYRNARILRKEPPKNKTDCAIDEFSLYNALWFVVGSFTQQGSDKQPLSPSGRWLISTWYLFALVVINTYIANLAAFLTNTNRGSAITDIPSLPFQSQLRYGTVASSQPEAFFQHTRVAAYARVWEGIRKDRSQLVNTVDEGIQLLRTTSYAFIWDEPALKFASQRQPCDIEVRGNPFDLSGYGIAMPLGSRFVGEVSQAILHLQETGVIHQLEEEWWDKRTQCVATTASQSSAEVITPSHVAGLIYVVAIGVAFSLFLMICEVFYYSWRKTRRDSGTSIKTVLNEWSRPRLVEPRLSLPLSSKARGDAITVRMLQAALASDHFCIVPRGGSPTNCDGHSHGDSLIAGQSLHIPRPSGQREDEFITRIPSSCSDANIRYTRRPAPESPGTSPVSPSRMHKASLRLKRSLGSRLSVRSQGPACNLLLDDSSKDITRVPQLTAESYTLTNSVQFTSRTSSPEQHHSSPLRNPDGHLDEGNHCDNPSNSFGPGTKGLPAMESSCSEDECHKSKSVFFFSTLPDIDAGPVAVSDSVCVLSCNKDISSCV